MANEKENYVKRNVKSSVFEDLFGNKSRLLELYRALHPEDVDAVEEDILNVTIQNHIVNGIYNDLGFNVRDRLREKYGYTKKAIVKTIKICKNKDILRRYLEEREREVIDMVDILNDEEYIMRSYTAEIVNETTKKVTEDITRFAIKSMIDLCKENALGKDTAITKIMKDYGKPESEAKKLVDKYYI